MTIIWILTGFFALAIIHSIATETRREKATSPGRVKFPGGPAVRESMHKNNASWTGTQPRNHAVIYRTGGTLEWAWHRVLNRLGADAAKAEAAAIERAGYRAKVVAWDTELPTSFEGEEA